MSSITKVEAWLDEDGNMWVTDYYSVAQAAAYLGLDRTTIHGHMRRRGLGRRFGPVWALSQADIDDIRSHMRKARA